MLHVLFDAFVSLYVAVHLPCEPQEGSDDLDMHLEGRAHRKPESASRWHVRESHPDLLSVPHASCRLKDVNHAGQSVDRTQYLHAEAIDVLPEGRASIVCPGTCSC